MQQHPSSTPSTVAHVSPGLRGPAPGPSARARGPGPGLGAPGPGPRAQASWPRARALGPKYAISSLDRTRPALPVHTGSGGPDGRHVVDGSDDRVRGKFRGCLSREVRQGLFRGTGSSYRGCHARGDSKIVCQSAELGQRRNETPGLVGDLLPPLLLPGPGDIRPGGRGPGPSPAKACPDPPPDRGRAHLFSPRPKLGAQGFRWGRSPEPEPPPGPGSCIPRLMRCSYPKAVLRMMRASCR